MILLSLGSNLGNNDDNISAAINHLSTLGAVTAVSKRYHTKPWGFESKHDFLNVVLSIETNLSPIELLDATQEIERYMGRTYKSVNGEYHDRVIDIDILDYNALIVKTERLTLPHPLLHKRDFVLLPLCDIAPLWEHPLLKLTAEALKEQLNA